MKKILLSLLLITMCRLVSAQSVNSGNQHPIIFKNNQVTYLSNNGSTVSCDGFFMDAGGNSSYPSNANNRTYTFCPEGNGNVMILNFTEFGLCTRFGNSDRIEIYAGSTDAAAYLIGSYTGNTSPGTVSNVGCLTVRFTRNVSNSCNAGTSRLGWKASIVCMPVEYYGGAGNPGVSDGGTCFKANPFCSAQFYNFTNLTGTSAPSGPHYGCLYTQPNPVWYFMSISEAGTMELSVSQSTSNTFNASANLDIDFAMWGPFNSVAEGCTRILSGTLPPIQCSYNPQNAEVVALGYTGGDNYQSQQTNQQLLPGQSTPPPAQQGQIYILLLTNYSNRSGYIRFRKTRGTAESDCSIVLLPLGIDLSSFQGENKNGVNYLQWVSENERIMSHYELERSVDGFAWNTIHYQAINEGFSESNHYVLEDKNYDKTENYYRLVSVNIDGEKTYSDIVTIDNRSQEKIIVGVYNELGQTIDRNVKGFKILVYNDGTTEKLFD